MLSDRLLALLVEDWLAFVLALVLVPCVAAELE
jgi:hypothetical protein